jgi:hypothetical protein
VGAGEIRAAQEEAGHALSRGNIVGGEEVGGADDEGVVGSDVGRGVVVVCSRALCGCRRGTHDGGGVFVVGRWLAWSCCVRWWTRPQQQTEYWTNDPVTTKCRANGLARVKASEDVWGRKIMIIFDQTLRKRCLIKTCTKGKEKLIEPPLHPRYCSLHTTPPSCAHVHLCSLHLARSTASGDVRAGGGLLTTSDGVTTPSPVGASALGAEDVDVGGRAGDCSGVLGHGQTSAVDFVS